MSGALTKPIICALALGAAWVCLCLATLVPVLGSASLGLWRVSEPTVPIHTTVTVTTSLHAFPQPTSRHQSADDAGENLVSKAKAACDHVPFLLRPIAAPPETARVAIVNDSGAEGVEWKVDCETGQMIDGSLKVH